MVRRFQHRSFSFFPCNILLTPFPCNFSFQFCKGDGWKQFFSTRKQTKEGELSESLRDGYACVCIAQVEITCSKASGMGDGNLPAPSWAPARCHI